MDTSLNVADARALLYTEVNATTPTDPLFLSRLNETCERYFYSGKWKGLIVKANYPAPQGFITLSRYHQALLAFRYKRVPRPVFSQFLTFSENGPGELEDIPEYHFELEDMGDGFVTQSDISTAGVLRVTISSVTDAAKAIRLFGNDQNGNEIFDTSGVPGINITTANPTADTSIQFSQVTGIQAPLMVSSWTLSVVNEGTPTQIGTYEPGERRPRYRRYRTGTMDEGVQVLVSRRFVPMVNETDWVIPGNLSALRCGLQGLLFEANGESDRCEASFARGVNYLNQEAKISRGAAIPVVNFLSEFSRGVHIGS